MSRSDFVVGRTKLSAVPAFGRPAGTALRLVRPTDSTPTLKHQRILRWLLGQFEAAAPAGSITLFAPLPARLFPGTIREPDLLYIAPENAPGPDVEYPSHIDLALEIVSPGKDARQRDYEDKRADYARAEISEYWIVDPQENQVTVLVLQDGTYVDHGIFRIGDIASGLLLPELSIEVRAMGSEKGSGTNSQMARRVLRTIGS